MLTVTTPEQARVIDKMVQKLLVYPQSPLKAMRLCGYSQHNIESDYWLNNCYRMALKRVRNR